MTAVSPMSDRYKRCDKSDVIALAISRNRPRVGLLLPIVTTRLQYIEDSEPVVDVIFFCRGWSDLDKMSQTGTE